MLLFDNSEPRMQGVVVWITGLAASGKTTFMGRLNDELRQAGIRPVCLDGDDLRQILRATDSKYTKAERLSLAHQYSELCAYLAKQGHTVLIATIALFHEIHDKNRASFNHYLEVLMDTPLEILQSRDPKGIYSRHSEGRLQDVAGLDWSGEFPQHPDFIVRPNALNQDSAIRGILAIVQSLQGNERQGEDESEG